MLEDPVQRGASSDTDTDMASEGGARSGSSSDSEEDGRAGDEEMTEARPYPWTNRSMHTGNHPSHSHRMQQRLLKIVRTRLRVNSSGLSKGGIGYTANGPARGHGPVMFQREEPAGQQHQQPHAEAGPSTSQPAQHAPPSAAAATPPATQPPPPTSPSPDQPGPDATPLPRNRGRRAGTPAPTPSPAPSPDPSSSSHPRTQSLQSWLDEHTARLSNRTRLRIIADLRSAHPSFWEGGHLEPHNLPPPIAAFLNAAYDALLEADGLQRTCQQPGFVRQPYYASGASAPAQHAAATGPSATRRPTG